MSEFVFLDINYKTITVRMREYLMYLISNCKFNFHIPNLFQIFALLTMG